MTTTFRQDVRAGILVALDAFKAANPTLLRKTAAAQPPSILGDLPIAYIDLGRETVNHDSGIRERIMVISVVVVSPMADNLETVARHNVLVDALLDHFTTYPHLVTAGSQSEAGSIWDEMTIEDEDFPVASDDGTVRHFYATRFTFANLSIQEGRV